MSDENTRKRNPIRALFDFGKEELPVVILMFFFFFLIITVFQLTRPLKKGLFVEAFGADVELYAKLLNIVISAIGVIVFTFLVNHFQRQRVIYGLSGFFAAGFLSLSFALAVPQPPAAGIWSFYLLGDLLSTMMVASFWAYLTDITKTDQAKRLYGAIGAGGVIGGWFGVSVSKFLLKGLGTPGLLLIAAGFTILIVVITFLVERKVRTSAAFEKEAEPLAEGPKTGAALEGAKLALRSKYLAAIVGIMLFYELGSQVNDYQFSKFSESLEGVANTQAYFTNVAFYANALAVVVQLFLVSLIMKRFGVVTALLVLPVAIALSSTSFFLLPSLMTASLLFISDNGFNYSIQQTSRESLYVVTSPDEKYKARAFTNMFVQRFAKGIGIFLLIGLGLLGLKGASVRFFSILTVTVMIVLIVLSIYAGRRFSELAEKQEAGKAPQM